LDQQKDYADKEDSLQRHPDPCVVDSDAIVLRHECLNLEVGSKDGLVCLVNRPREDVALARVVRIQHDLELHCQEFIGHDLFFKQIAKAVIGVLTGHIPREVHGKEAAVVEVAEFC